MSQRTRELENCPRCGAVMEQLPDREPLWTVAELAADLARMSDEIAESGTALLWYSRCPRGCHQCFGCRAWLAKDARCKVCPPCPECGGPLVLVADDDGDDDSESAREHFECMRCEGEEEDDDEQTQASCN